MKQKNSGFRAGTGCQIKGTKCPKMKVLKITGGKPDTWAQFLNFWAEQFAVRPAFSQFFQAKKLGDGERRNEQKFKELSLLLSLSNKCLRNWALGGLSAKLKGPICQKWERQKLCYLIVFWIFQNDHLGKVPKNDQLDLLKRTPIG